MRNSKLMNNMPTANNTVNSDGRVRIRNNNKYEKLTQRTNIAYSVFSCKNKKMFNHSCIHKMPGFRFDKSKNSQWIVFSNYSHTDIFSIQIWAVNVLEYFSVWSLSIVWTLFNVRAVQTMSFYGTLNTHTYTIHNTQYQSISIKRVNIDIVFEQKYSSIDGTKMDGEPKKRSQT